MSGDSMRGGEHEGERRWYVGRVGELSVVVEQSQMLTRLISF